MTTFRNSAFNKLEGKRVILASGSSARQGLFRKAGFPIEVFISGFPEDLKHEAYSTPEEYCLSTAMGKLDAILAQNVSADLIITADTLIALDDRIFEKPKDRNDAYETLKTYSGKTLKVITAVAFQINHEIKKSFCEVSLLTMLDLTDEMINGYLDENSWIHVSGSLSIEGYGMLLVDTVNGNYDSMTGFPMSRFYQEIMKYL